MNLRLVMLGDIVGQPGRLAVAQQIPVIRERWRPHLIIANAENAAKGSGLTPELYRKLCGYGVDGMTLGDHVYRRIEIVPVLEKESNLTRPANLSRHAKGRTWMKLQPHPDTNTPLPAVYIITVLGRLFMSVPADDPFECVRHTLTQLPEVNPIVVVEVHMEATSEKQALAWQFNGKVAAVLGTHTHVPTADARILPTISNMPGSGGTAFISDLGMCGPHESVLGRQIEPVLHHMITNMHAPFDVAENDPRVNGVCIDIDTQTRKATAIERIELKADPRKPPFV